MKFSAELRPGSYVDKSWKLQKRLGGVLHGVAFKKAGLVFKSLSADLTADQVAELRNHPDVMLVVTGVAIDTENTPLKLE